MAKQIISAACGCSMGKIRANNEDNFFFDGSFLPAENRALPSVITGDFTLDDTHCFAVFDGMGGEQYGEYAAFTAAKRLKEYLEPGKGEKAQALDKLEKITLELNSAVVGEAKRRLTRHMGATLAGLYFDEEAAYSFNLGDSRIYRVHAGEMHQISVDHVDSRALFSRKAKPGLTQYLGIDEEEFLVEPALGRHELICGDRYLICSDGLTDMLNDEDIHALLVSGESPEASVRLLISKALENGGKDNTTVIVCKVL